MCWRGEPFEEALLRKDYRSKGKGIEKEIGDGTAVKP